MIDYMPFRKEHLPLIRLQPAQIDEAPCLLVQEYAARLEREVAFSGWSGSDLLAIAGFLRVNDHRAIMFSLLDERAGRHFVSIVRFGRWMIQTYFETGVKRIEAYTRPDHAEGHRFLRMLGFKCDCMLLECFNETGQDVSLYSQVRR